MYVVLRRVRDSFTDWKIALRVRPFKESDKKMRFQIWFLNIPLSSEKYRIKVVQHLHMIE